jgi:hypothetical protein
MKEKKTLYRMKVKSDIDSDFKKYFDNPDRAKNVLTQIYLSGNKSKTSKKSRLTRDTNSHIEYYNDLNSYYLECGRRGITPYRFGEIITRRKLNQIETEIRYMKLMRKNLEND